MSFLSSEAKELIRWTVESAKNSTNIQQIQTSIYLNFYEEPSYRVVRQFLIEDLM